MKTLILGDTHGRANWKLAINNEKPDRVIFVGDYFDSFVYNTETQLNNFLDILEYKKSNEAETILLIGNHDHHYFPEIGDSGTSGYQQIGKYQIEPVIDSNRNHLQMAYQMDGLLITHAGVSTVFMNQVFGNGGWDIDNVASELNELFKYKPHAFTFNGFNGYGDDEEQTPIWIRPRSLMKSNKKEEIKKKYIQVFGHTATSGINLNHIQKAAGGRYYNIDCMETSGEYLIIEDGKISIGSVK